MATGTGTIYDGELTVYDAGTRTTAGYFITIDATANYWSFQITVTNHTSGNVNFDFEVSLDGTNWGHITVTTKHAGNLTINDNTTVMYFATGSPCRYVRAHITSMPSGPTVACKIGAM